MIRAKNKTVSGDWRFSIKIAVPIMVATLLVLAIAAYGIFRATRESDQASVDRQVRSAEVAIAAATDTLTRELEAVAVWNDTVAHTSPAGLDMAWIDENLGLWLYKLFDHDRAYVLDAADRPLYAMEGGVQVPAETFERIREDLADPVKAIRDPGLTPQPGQRKSTGRTVDVTLLRQVAGRPAAVTVIRVVPHTDDFPGFPPGHETLLLSIRFLDAGLLEDLRRENLLEAARFAVVPDIDPGEYAKPLTDGQGKQIGYLIWRPETPGARILGHLLPLFALTAGCVVALMLFLLRVLRRASDELKASEAHAQHLAFHDVLTGHPNRAQLMEALEEAMSWTRRGTSRRFALLLLDLDRFKQVNDALGHLAGDALLREFAARLSTVIRRGDLVARLGGDEFAIVQLGIAGPQDTEALCRRILEAVCHPFMISDSVNACVGVSIGVALAPDAGLDAVGLMRKADIALYRAKSEGKGRFCFFSEDMDEAVRQHARLEADLRTALERPDELIVHYQPQMSRDGRTLTGLEALIRWNHPELGLLPPARFLHVADECGLSVKLDEWVLDYTCRAMPRLPAVPVAVNLSPAQFYTDDLDERMLAIVTRHRVDPRRIELEVTERVLLEDNSASHDMLRRLRAAGFSIALDDFGTGYSSLSYLRRFRVDKIKVDQSFVRHLGRSTESTSIVRAIIGMGQALGLTVTAEGVENAEQQQFLAQFGCDQLQGYLFSKPTTEEGLAGFNSRMSPEAPKTAPALGYPSI